MKVWLTKRKIQWTTFQLKVEFKVEKLFRNFWESSPAAVPSATPSFGQSRSHSRGGAAHHVSTKIPKYLGANNIGKNYIICKKNPSTPICHILIKKESDHFQSNFLIFAINCGYKTLRKNNRTLVHSHTEPEEKMI